MNLKERIAESNRIEGIFRAPTPGEVAEHIIFVNSDAPTIGRLIEFVQVYQPGAILRDKPGLDVRIGNYLPPPGSDKLPGILKTLLDDAAKQGESPWNIHIRYERLHPFTDCNGRSGRVLWYWMMRNHPLADLGFLHAFYYQTLKAV